MKFDLLAQHLCLRSLSFSGFRNSFDGHVVSWAGIIGVVRVALSKQSVPHRIHSH
jgi:hypothetical protein